MDQTIGHWEIHHGGEKRRFESVMDGTSGNSVSINVVDAMHPCRVRLKLRVGDA